VFTVAEESAEGADEHFCSSADQDSLDNDDAHDAYDASLL
jgi:hypothetical protein